jgi:hypothetical protein
MQFDIIVKDSDAAPETGWVFTTFVYDRNAAKGSGPWDQLTPLGATWGNDPEADRYYVGHPPVDPKRPHAPLLKEFWRNPEAPQYSAATLGWGGRMSGPIDIAERHHVLLVKNVPQFQYKSDETCRTVDHPVDVTGPFRASGCLSCHGTAQTGVSARMYPSPIAAHLPSDGQLFCLYTPGTAEWAPWFQNRNGRTPQIPHAPASDKVAVTTVAANPVGLSFVRFGKDPRNVRLTDILKDLDATPQGLDYDMLLMFAISTAQSSSAKGFSLLPERQAVH